MQAFHLETNHKNHKLLTMKEKRGSAKAKRGKRGMKHGFFGRDYLSALFFVNYNYYTLEHNVLHSLESIAKRWSVHPASTQVYVQISDSKISSDRDSLIGKNAEAK